MHSLKNIWYTGVLLVFFIHFLLSIYAINMPFLSNFYRVKNLLNVILLVFSIIYIFRNKIRVNIILIVFVLYLSASSMLSEFNSTFQLINIIIDLLSYTATGIMFGHCLEFRKGLNIFFSFFFMLNVICILSSIVTPYTAIQSNGDWRGIFPQKNALASIIVFGVIINYIYIIKNIYFRKYIFLLFGWTSVCMSFFLIFKSHSATGIITTISLSLFLWYLLIMNRLKKIYLQISLSLFLGVLIICTVIILFNNIDNIFIFMQKDQSLTGRDRIYEYVKSVIFENPILGMGYSGIPNSYLLNSWTVKHSIGFNVYYAHNGLLEIMLQTGLVGLLIYLYLHFLILKSVFVPLQNRQIFYRFLILLLTAYYIIYNLTEVTFFTGEINNIHWLILCFLVSYSSKYKGYKNIAL